MDASPKQQIVERVKQATNILVTVSTNPSVDQLASCIGLTLMLNKLEKHATAVFSGKVPSTLEFLKPETTLETNTDSLRDFIISLDKSKADKLRYKVEDQMVRIFITPYRTNISEKDLIFSQGDFNVEVVIALGLRQREQVDQAIAAHGRILHDATVISINNGDGPVPEIGQINWQDSTASSLSEMIVSISEAFGTGLIDNQMATAFLTGIVAETDRFSNTKTSPKVMTMSAQLMAAGANQQLIAQELEPEPPTPPPAPEPPAEPLPPPVEPPKPEEPPTPPPQLEAEVKKSEDGSLTIPHESENGPGEIHIDDEGNLKTSSNPSDLTDPLQENSDSVTEPPTPPPAPEPPAEPLPPPVEPPKPEASSGEAKKDGTKEEPDEEKLLRGHERVIQPIDDLHKPSELSRIRLDEDGEPELGGTLTANTVPEHERYEDLVDPLSEAASKRVSESDNGMDSDNNGSTTENPLEKITQEIKSTSASGLNVGTTVDTPDANAARGAIDSAISTAPPDQQRLDPIAGLNAQPGLDLRSNNTPSQSSGDSQKNLPASSPSSNKTEALVTNDAPISPLSSTFHIPGAPTLEEMSEHSTQPPAGPVDSQQKKDAPPPVPPPMSPMQSPPTPA